MCCCLFELRLQKRQRPSRVHCEHTCAWSSIWQRSARSQCFGEFMTGNRNDTSGSRGTGGPAHLLPRFFFFKTMQFSCKNKGKPLFWANFGLRPPWGQNSTWLPHQDPGSASEMRPKSFGVRPTPLCPLGGHAPPTDAIPSNHWPATLTLNPLTDVANHPKQGKHQLNPFQLLKTGRSLLCDEKAPVKLERSILNSPGEITLRRSSRSSPLCLLLTNSTWTDFCQFFQA